MLFRSKLAYELKLPPSFKIHPVISVSRLEPAKADGPRPRVTLKVRDPAENRRSLFKISRGDTLPFEPRNWRIERGLSTVGGAVTQHVAFT